MLIPPERGNARRAAAVLIIAALLACSLFPLLSPQPVSAAGSWLTGWGYRKSHVINPASGAGTDYQVNITVHFGSGTDSNKDVYLNGKCRTDFGDVRFTGADGTTLLYCWMQSKVDSDSAVFWIKVADDLSSTARTIYVYYGNPSATTASNFDNTFIFGEPWDSTTLNTARWTSVDGSPTYSINTAGHYLEVTDMAGGNWWNGMGFHSRTVAFPASYIVEDAYSSAGVLIQHYSESASQIFGALFSVDDGPWTSTFGVAFGRIGDSWAGDADWYKSAGVGENGDWDSGELGGSAGTWYSLSTRIWKLAGNIKVEVDGTLRVDEANSQTPNVVHLGIARYSSYGFGTERFYAFKIRKYVSPEPSHGAWGPEEVPGTAPAVDGLTLDLTGASYKGTKTLLAGRQDYNFTLKVSDADGVANINYAEIRLDPAGKNVILRWTESTGVFSEQSDPNNYVMLNTGTSSHYTTGNQKVLKFYVMINWNWDDSAETIPVQVYVVDDASMSDTKDYASVFGVENDLSPSTLTVSDYRCSLSQTLTFSGYWYYEGTTIAPPDGDYQVKVKLGGVQKGSTDTTLVSGAFSIDAAAEQSVGSYSYTVEAAHMASAGTFPAVVADRLDFPSITADDTRVNVGGTFELRYKIRYAYDGATFDSSKGSVSGFTWDSANGWWKKTVTGSSTVCSTTYDENYVTIVDSTYGITAKQDVAGVSVVTDRIKVTFLGTASASGRVNVGALGTFYATAILEFDGHPLGPEDSLTLSGYTFAWNAATSRFEYSTSSSTIQAVTIDAYTSGYEATYGITAGTIDGRSATITWDGLNASAYTADPEADTVRVRLVYAFNGAAVNGGTVGWAGKTAITSSDGWAAFTNLGQATIAWGSAAYGVSDGAGITAAVANLSVGYSRACTSTFTVKSATGPVSAEYNEVQQTLRLTGSGTVYACTGGQGQPKNVTAGTGYTAWPYWEYISSSDNIRIYNMSGTITVWYRELGTYYVTYYSGEDVFLSLSGGVTTVREVLSRTCGNVTEEFSAPPYTYAYYWAAQNGWSSSGSCPVWSGTLWCGVTSDGYLQWHNWLHTIGGSVYDFRMWKDVNPGQYFELYMPLSSWRRYPSGGVAGAPILHIGLRLYDSAGVRLFMMDLPYDMGFGSATIWLYESNRTVGSGTLNFKLWQNSTGAYFSSDNGTTAVYLGTFYTEPARVEVWFYIWEHNSIQPYSDEEYCISIDKVVLRPLSSQGVTFSGLPAGSWYLINEDGRVLANTNTTVHGSTLVTSSPITSPFVSDEFDDIVTTGWTAVSLVTFSESGGYLNTYAQPNTWGTWSGARYALPTPWSGDFYAETYLTYTGQSSDLAVLYLAVANPSGSVIAYAGVCDSWAACNPQWACGVTDGSSWATGENTMPGSGTVTIRIQRSGSTWTITASGAYSGTWTTSGSTDAVGAIYLVHEHYSNFNGKTANWDYVRTNIPAPFQPDTPLSVNGTLAGLVDYTYVRRGTLCANTTVTYSQDFNTLAAVNNPPQSLQFYDDCSSASAWYAPSGMYAHYYYAGYDFYISRYPATSDGNSVYTYFFWGMLNGYTYSGDTYLQRPLSLSSVHSPLTIHFQAKCNGPSGANMSVSGVTVTLSNGTELTNSSPVNLGNDDWRDCTYTLAFNDVLTVTNLRISFSGTIAAQGCTYLYIDNVTLNYVGDPGLTIVGVPANDIVKVYQGTTLKKTVVSNGSDVVVSPTDVPQPFDGSIVVVSRPYARVVTSYTGTIDWNDQLTYSGGTLTRSGTGAQFHTTSTGSECSSTSGWTFAYNLYTGGTAPTVSSSGGYIRFDESSLQAQGEPAPYLMEAAYDFEYPLNTSGTNFTISVSADGGGFSYKWYYAKGDYWVYVGYGQITVYCVQGSTWTQVAQSSQSTTPSLTTTVTNISPSGVSTIDTIVVRFYTYGRGSTSATLCMDSAQWGRVDYLRVNYSSVPNEYPGVPVTGLQPGQRVTIADGTYWANSTGTVVISLNAATWPYNGSVTVYPPSESYTGTFEPGKVYYLKTTKVYSQKIDTLYCELDTTDYTYRAELKLLSSSSPLLTGGSLQYITFTFKTFENGNLLPADKAVPRVLVNGFKVDAESVGDYTWRVQVPPNAFIEAYAPTGIRVSGTLR